MLKLDNHKVTSLLLAKDNTPMCGPMRVATKESVVDGSYVVKLDG